MRDRRRAGLFVAMACAASTLTSACGANGRVLTAWVVTTGPDPSLTSTVTWDTAACVAVAPGLTLVVGDVVEPHRGGGYTNGGGMEWPTCTPPQAEAVVSSPPRPFTAVDLVDGDTRVARMEHPTLAEARTLTLESPASIVVGDTLRLVMSHDDDVARATFVFRFGGGRAPLVEASRAGPAFSVVVPAAALGATLVEGILEDARVPVTCTRDDDSDFECVFGIGVRAPEEGIPTLEVERDVDPPIAAGP
jgi:hypothetical protein